MSIRLYNDALRESAENPSHPTEDDIPRKPKNPKKGKTVAIIAVVVVVLISTTVGTILVTDYHHSLNIGVISEITAASFANQRFVARYVNDTSGNVSQNITKGEAVFFSNSSSNSLITIDSLEFSSRTYSLNVYDKSFKKMTETTNGTLIPGFKNGTYDGFNFFYFIHRNSTGFNLIALGVSGSFSFNIEVMNVQVSNYIPLIHDEIKAMTG